MCLSKKDNSLGAQLSSLYSSVELSVNDYERRIEICDDLRDRIRTLFPDSDLHIVGSVASKMASINSDLDILVNTTGCSRELRQMSESEKVKKIYELVKSEGCIYRDVKVMVSNSVSLIMCCHSEENISITIRVDHMEALRIALFMKVLSELHPTLRLLCVVIREWALVRQLIRRKGALTGYNMALLVVYYFEQVGRISVDTVKVLSMSNNKTELQNVIKNWTVTQEATDEEIGELFYGFMQYFGKFGLFESCVISLVDERTKKRPSELKKFKVCILDPVTGANAGCGYSRMSDPEEPFVKTAANLRKHQSVFAAFITRGVFTKRRRNPIFDLAIFKSVFNVFEAKFKVYRGRQQQVEQVEKTVVKPKTRECLSELQIVVESPKTEEWRVVTKRRQRVNRVAASVEE